MSLVEMDRADEARASPQLNRARNFFIFWSFLKVPCAEQQNGCIGRPARSLKTKKPPDSGKTGNEGIQRILMKTDHQAGLILLIDGEVIPCGIRRAQSNR